MMKSQHTNTNNKGKPLNMHSSPHPQDLSRRSGLLHSIVWREAKGSKATMIFFSFQSKDNNNKKYQYQQDPVLVAVKTGSSDYAIYSDYPKLTDVAGRLVMTQKTMSHIHYSLFDEHRSQIASILYDVPSILKAVRKHGTARSATLALKTGDCSSFNDTELVDKNIDGTTLADSWFQVACETSILKKRSLAYVQDFVGENKGNVALFRHKEPYLKSDGKTFGLNFHGRGRQASNKNMQLVERADGAAGVVCQMAKWDTNVFHVDFAAPFTPLVAFGFALAQLDL